MPEYTLDPGEWVEGSTLQDYYDASEDVGFFHVTTNIDAVRVDGRLRSRQDLGTIGLGGGPSNDAPNLVSFTFDLSRATWLYEAVRVAAHAARNEMLTIDVIMSVIEWTGFPSDQGWSRYLDDLYEEDDEARARSKTRALLDKIGYEPDVDDETVDALLRSQTGWRKWLQSPGVIDALEEGWQEHLGRFKYQLIQNMEDGLRLHFYDEANWDDGMCVGTVGLTAPWMRFVSIDPAQLSIVQVEVRRGAKADAVADECELRFRPADVKIVRYDVEAEGVAAVTKQDEGE